MAHPEYAASKIQEMLDRLEGTAVSAYEAAAMICNGGGGDPSLVHQLVSLSHALGGKAQTMRRRFSHMLPR